MFPDKIFLGMSLYDIFLTIGAVLALLIADSFATKRGFSVALQKGLLLAGVGAIIVGYGFAVLFQSVYSWIETGVFDLVGATFYGGLIGGAGLFLLLWFFVLGRFCKDKDEPKKRFGELADIAGVVIPLAHGFGRLGCLFAGCCHGKITDAWYAVPMKLGGVWVNAVPVQLYEALFLFALSCAAWLLMKYRQGEKRIPLLPVYLTGYGVWRFFIEYARADNRGETILSFLTPSQLTAVVLVAVGIGYFAVWFMCKKRAKDGSRLI